MKKILAMAIGLAAVACVASAETYSQNAVGFIQVSFEQDQLQPLSIPFRNMANDTGTWKFNEIPAFTNAPRGSVVYFFNGTSWDPFPASRNGGFPNVTKELEPGECFFLQWGGEATQITLAGEVPDDDDISVVVMGKNNLSAIANPYPTQMPFKDTQVATNALRGSQVYFWNGKSWDNYPASRNGGFPNVTQNLEPGVGFFFRTSEDDNYDSKEWKVTRPYDWPHPPVP